MNHATRLFAAAVILLLVTCSLVNCTEPSIPVSEESKLIVVEQPTIVAEPSIDPGPIEFEKLSLPFFVDRDVKTIAIPQHVRNLVGERVKIRGYMYPTEKERRNPFLVLEPEIKTASRKSSDSAHCGTDSVRTDVDRIRLMYCVPVLLHEGDTIECTDDRFRKPLVIEGTLKLEGDAIDLEFGAVPFLIEDATYQETAPRAGYGRSWGWGC